MLVAFLSRYVLATTMQGYPYLLFIPAVFASSLLFDRGSGFFATGLSALLAFYFFVPPARVFLADPAGDLLALILFVAISGAIAFVTEALRLALEQVAAAERGKDLLLREVEHRVRNDLQGITSVLSLEQRKVAAPEAREGLQRAAERVQVLSRVYGRLTRRESRAMVDVRPFLEDLAADLRQVRIDGQPVSLEARIEDATVTLNSAAALGLIANELVTNAVKHAFPDERPGRIELAFRAGRRRLPAGGRRRRGGADPRGRRDGRPRPPAGAGPGAPARRGAADRGRRRYPGHGAAAGKQRICRGRPAGPSAASGFLDEIPCLERDPVVDRLEVEWLAHEAQRHGTAADDVLDEPVVALPAPVRHASVGGRDQQDSLHARERAVEVELDAEIVCPRGRRQYPPDETGRFQVLLAHPARLARDRHVGLEVGIGREVHEHAHAL